MSEPLRYSIVIERASEDQVFVVGLPEWGDLIHTHGATYEETLQRGKELVEGLIAARQERGDPLLDPQTFVGV